MLLCLCTQVVDSGEQSNLQPPALLHVNQHLLGSGDDMGTWMLELRNALPEKRAVLVCTATMIPWFLQAWLHTLQISIDGQPVPLDQVTIAQISRTLSFNLLHGLGHIEFQEDLEILALAHRVLSVPTSASPEHSTTRCAI
jgi:hypothetical protein